MTTPSDDECIALAMLHGCAFRQFAFRGNILWYASPSSSHPYDLAEHTIFKRTGDRYYFRSRAELARVYCEVHKLFGDPHDHSTQLRSGHAA